MSRQLEPNSTQTPDIIFDEWLPLLTANEAKIVFFVARKTYGWNKRHERLGAADIQAGAGLGRSSVFGALASLESVGLMLIKHGERGGKTNDYALNVRGGETVTAALIARQGAEKQTEKTSPKHPRTRPTDNLDQQATYPELDQLADYPRPTGNLALDQQADYATSYKKQEETPPVVPNANALENTTQHKTEKPPASQAETAVPRSRKSVKPEPYDPEGFAAFWRAHPRRVAKQKALAAWRALRPDAETQSEILAGILRFMALPEWDREGCRFVAMPATYLNGRRWEDELTPVSVSAAPPAPVRLYDPSKDPKFSEKRGSLPRSAAA